MNKSAGEITLTSENKNAHYACNYRTMSACGQSMRKSNTQK